MMRGHVVHRGRTKRAVFLGTFAVLALARGIRAEELHPSADARVRFAWVRGDEAGGCPDQRSIEAGVISRIGRDPFVEDGRLSIEGAVEHSGAVWRADIRVRDQHGALVGRRALDTEAPDCGPLAEAVVLAVALVIDPNAATRTPRPAGAAPPPVVPVPSQPPPVSAPCPVAPPCPIAAPCPACPKAEHRRDSTEVSTRIVGTVGILPRAAFGPGLFGGYGTGPLELTASLWWLPEVSTSDGRFAFGFVAGSAGGCYRVPLGTGAALGACGNLDLGSMHAVVRDLRDLVPLDPGEQLVFAADAGPRLTLEPGPLRLEAGVGAFLPISGKTFRIQGSNTPVSEPPAVAGIAFLGIGFGVP